jgi:hypothetical protein
VIALLGLYDRRHLVHLASLLDDACFPKELRLEHVSCCHVVPPGDMRMRASPSMVTLGLHDNDRNL